MRGELVLLGRRSSLVWHLILGFLQIRRDESAKPRKGEDGSKLNTYSLIELDRIVTIVAKKEWPRSSFGIDANEDTRSF